MPRIVSGLMACFLTFSACLSAVELKGKITDPSGAPVPGAQVALVNRVGVVAQTTAGASGGFLLDAPQTPDTRLVVAAPGFLTRTLALDEATSVQLEIAPRVDTVQVVGSTIELPATLQGSSVDVIPSARVRSSNEPFAMDLLRYIPGVAFNQSGSPGGVTSLFLRGGNSNLNLVADRRRPGELVRRQLRFCTHSGRGRGPCRFHPRSAIGRLWFIRECRRHRLRDAASGIRAPAQPAGGRRQPQRTPLRDHGHGDRRRLWPVDLGVALRQRWSGGQRRLPQRRRAAQPHAALRPPECVAARLLRFQRGGRAGPVRLQSEAYLYRHRPGQPRQE